MQPWTTASIGMVYNPTLLASVGYKEPPKTLAQFEDCLAKLRAKDKDLIPYALSTKDATATADYQPWLWTFGGSIFDASGWHASAGTMKMAAVSR
jgi:multiple sugar transport system substrate-binding protein